MSTIGVDGTVVSITIAALSLAAGQTGPRLLRNFTRDRGNQVTLGAFLGTVSYALTVLRSVRTTEESLFTDTRGGCRRHVDAAALAEWARRHGTALLLLRRPGDYVFPGAPIAMMTRAVNGAAAAIRAHSALAATRSVANDLEDAIRQLVEVGLRALSAGINDPHTRVPDGPRSRPRVAPIAPIACRAPPLDGHVFTRWADPRMPAAWRRSCVVSSFRTRRSRRCTALESPV